MKNIFYALLFFLSFHINAQNVLEVVGEESCKCIENKKLDFKKLSKNEVQAQVGLCIIQSYTNHIDEFSEEDRIDFSDAAGMRGLGEKVAIKMLSFCPEMIMNIGRVAIDENKKETLNDQILEIKGIVVDIVKDQFVTIKVKDENSRIHNFFLLNYFETAYMYTNNQIKKNEKITISYSEVELYDVKNLEFRYFKVISKLKL
jgi:hypothetical protein